jgi:hypothetical protein
MRLVVLALCVLLGTMTAFAQDEVEEEGQEQEQAKPEAKDAWLGCWTKVYDAAHLKQHSGQLVTAMTVTVTARTPEGDEDKGNYLAKIRANFRNKPETYANQDGARCEAVGANKDRLHCVNDSVFLSDFWLEQAAKNVKLAMHDPKEDVVLVPGVDTSAFVRLTPQNPEHSAFLLQPTCAKPKPAAE